MCVRNDHTEPSCRNIYNILKRNRNENLWKMLWKFLVCARANARFQVRLPFPPSSHYPGRATPSNFKEAPLKPKVNSLHPCHHRPSFGLFGPILIEITWRMCWSNYPKNPQEITEKPPKIAAKICQLNKPTKNQWRWEEEQTNL